ncbi:MAG: YidC/Oxa1 family membrane protein insertase [Patescibacteria group bacterium]
MDKQKLLNYALIVVITILLLQTFNNKKEQQQIARDDLQIVAENEITTGSAVILNLQNNTPEKITLANDCPNEPFSVSKYSNGEWREIFASIDSARCESGMIELLPSEKISVNYQPWQRELFSEVGKYRIEILVEDKTFLHEVEIKNTGIFGKIWRTVVYQPIYNTLIFLTKVSGNSFGWGIILLTVLLRAILFVPFQKSLKSQRKLQKIQPEIEAIKKRFAGNQQMIAMETMALMKKNKVSPFGSCLPILIQMPFLLALFWATQDGLGENNFVFLYSFLRDFDLAGVSTNFFGLELLTSGAQFFFVLPLFLAASQFVQMKLAMHHSAKNKPAHKPGENPMQDAMHSMTKMMPYFLPVMIGFFSASLPAAVGIYWGASTLFGVGQQLIVNRQVK